MSVLDDNWAIYNAIETQILYKSNLQFLYHFPAVVFISLFMQHLTVTAHHLQTSGKMKCFNKYKVAGFVKFVA